MRQKRFVQYKTPHWHVGHQIKLVLDIFFYRLSHMMLLNLILCWDISFFPHICTMNFIYFLAVYVGHTAVKFLLAILCYVRRCSKNMRAFQILFRYLYTFSRILYALDSLTHCRLNDF